MKKFFRLSIFAIVALNSTFAMANDVEITTQALFIPKKQIVQIYTSFNNAFLPHNHALVRDGKVACLEKTASVLKRVSEPSNEKYCIMETAGFADSQGIYAIRSTINLANPDDIKELSKDAEMNKNCIEAFKAEQYSFEAATQACSAK